MKYVEFALFLLGAGFVSDGIWDWTGLEKTSNLIPILGGTFIMASVLWNWFVYKPRDKERKL